MEEFKILAINPGSTSTKIALFKNEKMIMEDNIMHLDEINRSLEEEFIFRKNLIDNFFKEKNILVEEISAISARGGLLKPISGGVYKINKIMLDDLWNERYGKHPCNLGAILAESIGEKYNIPRFIVDPVVVDEMAEVAKLTGLKEIKRKSIFHCLNQRAVAKEYSKLKNKKYENLNLIVAHLGGGISIGFHKKGKIVDVNNALNGDGPFSPERSGGLPVEGILNLIFEKKYSKEKIMKKIKGEGGIYNYLGTKNLKEIIEQIEEIKEYKLIVDGMIYQIVKEIGSLYGVANGDIDGVIFTGGISYSEYIIQELKEKLKFIKNIEIFPGEMEMKALVFNILDVLRNEVEIKEYK